MFYTIQLKNINLHNCQSFQETKYLIFDVVFFSIKLTFQPLF